MCFLNEWDLAMVESLVPANEKQPAPRGDLRIRDLKGCDTPLRVGLTRVEEGRPTRKGEGQIGSLKLSRMIFLRISHGYPNNATRRTGRPSRFSRGKER